MLQRLFRHSKGEGDDCTRLCCTKIEHFTVKVGNLTIFEDVNLHVHCGQLTAVIGPNGAGKSTLLRAIIGEVSHTGHLNYVDAKGKHTGKPIIGYVPQFLKLDVSAPITVLDLFSACLSDRPVWLFPSNKRQQVLDSLKRVRATELIDRRLGALSGGELQRVLLALALNPMPDILLLDEPTRGIDVGAKFEIYSLMNKLVDEGMSIIMISSELPEVLGMSDRLYVMSEGTITGELSIEEATEEKVMAMAIKS